jgi:translocating chain-associated membrane protein 1
MQRIRNRGNKGDGPPLFSYEFIIQNHADIVSCICMVIFMLLIPQATNSFASGLIFIHNNVTVPVEGKDAAEKSSVRLDKQKALQTTMYYHGTEDVYNVVFYCLVWIIIHALLQEYIWERTVKRLHLSKVKTSKYYDSGCLVVFYLVSVVWGLDIIISSGYATNPPLLWTNYPHSLMSLSLKFFMLTQMGFWLHCYPELVFMKAKKDEIYSKVVLYTSSLLIIAGAYSMMLQRVAVVLLVFHYAVEFLYHLCRMLHYYGKSQLADPG